MTNFAGGKIQAFVGPKELGAKDDLEEEIIKFIKGAKKNSRYRRPGTRI